MHLIRGSWASWYRTSLGEKHHFQIFSFFIFDDFLFIFAIGKITFFFLLNKDFFALDPRQFGELVQDFTWRKTSFSNFQFFHIRRFAIHFRYRQKHFFFLPNKVFLHSIRGSWASWFRTSLGEKHHFQIFSFFMFDDFLFILAIDKTTFFFCQTKFFLHYLASCVAEHALWICRVLRVYVYMCVGY